MNYLTKSYTGPGAGGNWFKLTLNQIHCVQRVLKYDNTGAPDQTWTCSVSSCSCDGENCGIFTMIISNEGATSNLSPVSDCKYGNTVMYKRISGNNMAINEMVIIGKQGKVHLLYFFVKIQPRKCSAFPCSGPGFDSWLWQVNKSTDCIVRYNFGRRCTPFKP